MKNTLHNNLELSILNNEMDKTFYIVDSIDFVKRIYASRRLSIDILSSRFNLSPGSLSIFDIYLESLIDSINDIRLSLNNESNVDLMNSESMKDFFMLMKHDIQRKTFNQSMKRYITQSIECDNNLEIAKELAGITVSLHFDSLKMNLSLFSLSYSNSNAVVLRLNESLIPFLSDIKIYDKNVYRMTEKTKRLYVILSMLFERDYEVFQVIEIEKLGYLIFDDSKYDYQILKQVDKSLSMINSILKTNYHYEKLSNKSIRFSR